MTDDQLDALMPGPGDFRRAKVFVAAWATDDLPALSIAFAEVREVGNTRRFFGALAELLTHGYDLRDNAEALAQWRADIAKYAADENNEQEG
ncbi:hypothetical protein [Mycobacterium sp.]|uniref:hypothetical protein n=1 Tax=Mycobacterium sp. TaxID=1785 RepID=UPI003F94FF78